MPGKLTICTDGLGGLRAVAGRVKCAEVLNGRASKDFRAKRDAFESQTLAAWPGRHDQDALVLARALRNWKVA